MIGLPTTGNWGVAAGWILSGASWGSKDSATRCAEIRDSDGRTAEGRGCRGHGWETTVTRRFGTKQGGR